MKLFIRTQGFTLIETMSALAVIAVLMSIAITTYGDYQQKIDRRETINLMNQLTMELQRHRNRYGTYPGKLTTSSTIHSQCVGGMESSSFNDTCRQQMYWVDTPKMPAYVQAICPSNLDTNACVQWSNNSSSYETSFTSGYRVVLERRDTKDKECQTYTIQSFGGKLQINVHSQQGKANHELCLS